MTRRKLTIENVLAIRANSTHSNRELSAHYGVSSRVICDVRNNKIYTDVKSPDGISNRRSNRNKATKAKAAQTPQAGELKGWTYPEPGKAKAPKTPCDRLTAFFIAAHITTLAALAMLLVKVLG